jgi:hypothetical protein
MIARARTAPVRAAVASLFSLWRANEYVASSQTEGAGVTVFVGRDSNCKTK